MQLTLTTQYSITKTTADRFKLRIWVTEAVGIASEVFLIRSSLAMPTDAAAPVFVRVCSYADMANYGTAVDSYRRHYRVRSLDMIYTNKQELETDLVAIQTGLTTLKADVQAVIDSTPAITTQTISWLTVTKTLLSGNSNSKQLKLVLSTADGTKDPALFLVAKSSSGAAINTAELVAIASPEDLTEYAATEIYPGFYRTVQVEFVFPSAAAKDTVLAAIVADLTDTVGAITAVAATGTQTLSATLGNTNTVIQG